ncbi:zinc-binding dehydrogenase [Kitasatospora sp. NPDC006697]|uniref:zinc-dependent alcohol dehydrogenase n=1 Tax=Kitasatospora sp. NPDC006697 TaxID=3364020 RepID=UPI0036756AD7
MTTSEMTAGTATTGGSTGGMRAAELLDRFRLTVHRDLEVPAPGPGEVLVRVGACTVCNRSDLAYYHYLGLREHCAVGCFGHEVAGTVEAVGAGATSVPGERVFLRTPITTGFADFALARQISVGRLPDHVPFEQGAILQLLPLAIHATRGVRLGDRVAVIGQGPVGLMTLQVVRRRGAAEVVAADLDPWRLERSAALGADRTVPVPAGGEAARELLGGGFDVAIDAVGTPETANLCVDLVRQNGLVIFLGTHHVDTRVSFDMIAWEKKGLRVHMAAEPTDLARAATMATAERLAGQVELAPLLSAAYPLDRLQDAIDRLAASSLLTPSGEPSPYPGPPRETLKLAVVP